MTQYNIAKQLILEHIDMLDRIGKALLEYETIDGRELEIICAAKSSLEASLCKK